MAKKHGLLAILSLPVVAGICALSGQPKPAADPGTIAPAGHMTIPRFFHTATLLKDNTVHIAGGMQRNGVFEARAETYDPATGRFAATGEMQSVRGWGTTATLLGNGKVL